MVSFKYQGKVYRSLKECCQDLHISYSKVRRLTRHYVRAHDDPILAVRWVIGEEYISYNEQKTEAYYKDMELAAERQMKFRDNCRERLKAIFET